MYAINRPDCQTALRIAETNLTAALASVQYALREDTLSGRATEAAQQAMANVASARTSLDLVHDRIEAAKV